MRYYISDLHFFHNALNERMDHRGFASLEDMHAHMIAQWNSKVRKNDEVVILGDFSLGKVTETEELLKQLNGKKFLIKGNHDKYLENPAFDQTLFGWVADYKELSDNRRKVVLSHYPVFCYNGQYLRDKEGNPKTYMLYGHVHDTYDEVLVNRFVKETRASERMVFGYDTPQRIACQMINCFCMYSDYIPLTLDEWIEVDEKRRAEMNKE